MSRIDAATARSLIASDPGVRVLDVRTPGEFASAHIAGAVNLPLDQAGARLRDAVAGVDGRVLLVCQSGVRAERARSALGDAGPAGVAVLDGGMNAWTASGGAVERGRARWALERQVRLVAGSVVLASVVASLWIPAAAAVAALIGAGLAVAALTDTCAMGMLLAKLPYNRAGGVDVEAAIARLRQGPSEAGA
ncbi:sulfurtransferase [Sphaerisporangium krabiense]|uniref:Rhodanese-related sulfurtransferase n=1 Tax=Sphaerisporangium krabiense TaxID=763782 RepID=A0A7W8Z9K3_9ACTN|nr:rhodanese-like domain-containing protein [Sphaerisporangium krabiense]MBB5629876.1 rhodanese-related sulfurtransferase [Sphaerisporangium krabiense]GII63977.1 sulfurtransferase [Sphaerisporangium krabiense]